MPSRLVLGVLASFLGAASAQAVTFTGPLIQSAIPDRSRYAPGALVTIPLELKNTTAAPVSGTVSCQRYGRSVAVGEPSAAALPPLAPAATTTVTVRFALDPALDNRGYQVICAARDGAGATLDTAATAIDVSSDWATFARECMVTQFGPDIDVEAELRGLRAYHCSVGQFYDAYWQPHRPYSPAPRWQNLENTTVSAATLRAYIAGADRTGMAPLLFIDWAAAGNHFQTDGSGIPLAWGLFREPIRHGNRPTNCAPACTAANLARLPSLADGTFPTSWTSLWIVGMDPTNRDWWRYWVATTRAMVDGFGFAGCQVDTLGDFGVGYTIEGRVVDYTHAASDFINANLPAACRRGTFNTVSSGLAEDTVKNSKEDFYYSERHPEFGDAPHYRNIHDSAGLLTAFGAKAQNYAIYMDQAKAQMRPCSTTGQQGDAQTCTFGEPGMRYTDAVTAASGVWNNNIIDGPPATPDDPLFISNILVSSARAQLAALPSTRQAKLDDASFAVAHQKEFRDQSVDVDGTTPASVVAGGCGSSMTGEPGKLYLIPRSRPGLQMLHIINFCSLTAATVDSGDTHGDQPAASPQSGVTIKMYYSGSVTGSNNLWLSSPDRDHGAPQRLSYAKGTDAGGRFVTFTVAVDYWDYLALERDDLATSDYAEP